MKVIFKTLLLALLALAFVRPLSAQIGITVAFGPPALPVYDQPICPGDGFLWVPGYWAYDDDDGYYWVPGTWVEAPEPGYLWTPGWWGWENGGFLFHEGYWGTEVGFYGGIDYGFGYFGDGFVGGRWDGGHFFYNRAVLNVDVSFHNVYNTPVERRETENRVSYNGGDGGVTARPTAHEQEIQSQRHIPPVAAQTQHVQAARSNPQMRAETNRGKPPVAATSRPGAFSGGGVVAAKAEGAPYRPAPSRNGAPAAGARPEGSGQEGSGQANANPTHAKDLQPHAVQTAPSSGDPRSDMKYQQDQQRLVNQQNQEHQKLQQQQDKEDQKITRQNNPQKTQQVEQRHQQQTQQLEQKHTQQQQEVQRRAPAPKPAARKPE